MRSHSSIIWKGVLTASLLLPIGCQKSEIRIYDTAKDTSPAAAPSSQLSGPFLTANPISWTPDDQWQTLPPTQFRKGNYLYTDDAGSAEITVTSFPGATGGTLANVNRWLRQASLSPIDEQGLADLVETIELSGGIKASLVDLKAEGEAPSSTRIYAAIVPFQSDSWFFKLSGPSAVVETQIPALEAMVKNIEFGGNQQSASNATIDHEGDLAFNPPDGWAPTAGNSLRIASFTIVKEGSPPGDFSIIAFPGDTGGVAANVNRWRRQIGLADWSEDEVEAEAKRLENEAGFDFLVFDLKPGADQQRTVSSERILAAIMEHGGKSWFFKLRGTAFLVDTQQSKFESLLQSVHFDHSGHAH